MNPVNRMQQYRQFVKIGQNSNPTVQVQKASPIPLKHQ